MRRTCRGNRLLERRFRNRLGPWLAAFDGQFAGGLDRWLVRRDASTEVIEHRQPGTLLDAGEDDLQFGPMQRLLLQEFRRQHVEHIAVFGQDRPGLVVRGLDQLADFVVDIAGDLVAVVGLGAHGATQERVAMLGAVADRTQFGAHAVLGHHRAGDLGGLLNIGDRTRGGLAEHQLFGGAPTHGEYQAGDHLRTGHQALVVLGHAHRVPAGAAASQDGDLIDRLDIGHRPRRQGVAALVVGGDLLLRLADDPTFATRTADDPVDGLFQRRPGDDGPVLAGSEQGGLVDHVGQIRTRHSDGALGQTVEVCPRCQRLALRVHPQHRLAAGQVGRGHRDLPIESTRTQQCRIEDVGPVGGRDQDDALALTEAVHLDE